MTASASSPPNTPWPVACPTLGVLVHSEVRLTMVTTDTTHTATPDIKQLRAALADYIRGRRTFRTRRLRQPFAPFRDTCSCPTST